jgi:putative SOS response-associated peptidase YedK
VELRNRMPVVLGPSTWPAWLGEEPADVRQLKAMLAPYPSDEMTRWPISMRVGNVTNNDPNQDRACHWRGLSRAENRPAVYCSRS